jgi:hypothetical protein
LHQSKSQSIPFELKRIEKAKMVNLSITQIAFAAFLALQTISYCHGFPSYDGVLLVQISKRRTLETRLETRLHLHVHESSELPVPLPLLPKNTNSRRWPESSTSTGSRSRSTSTSSRRQTQPQQRQQVVADTSTQGPGRAVPLLPETIPRLSDLMKRGRDQANANAKANAYTSSVKKSTSTVVSPVNNNNNTNKKLSKPKPSPTKKPSTNRKQINTNNNKTAPPRAKPWRAGFKASIRTQGKIKKAFETPKDYPNERAVAILNALLTTSPHYCNSANVVAALTYSAKAMGNTNTKHTQTSSSEQVRSLLFQTLTVLNQLVQADLLNARQLCNAAWAIAKHVDRDDSLLPPHPKSTALSSDKVVGVAETWELEETDPAFRAQQRRVDDTVNEIAVRLTTLLLLQVEVEDNKEETQNPRNQPKVGEICMASWAYGILRPRHRPPGWQVPPQLGRLNNGRSQKRNSGNFITFEQWSSFSVKTPEQLIVLASEEVTDKLFDAIGGALTKSPVDQVEKDIASEQEDNWFEEHDTPQQQQRVRGMQLESCTWSELANVGWAFASHGSCKSVPSEALLLGLAREASHRLRQGDKAVLTRDIAQLVWALGTLQSDNFRLADDLVYLVEALTGYLRLSGKSASFGRGRPLRRWSCPDLVQTALSLAHARIDELPLLRAVYEESSYRLMEGRYHHSQHGGERRSFQAWEVSILLWAQARLYLKGAQGPEFDDFAQDAPKWLIKAVQSSQSSLKDVGISAQEQANIAWSLTVLEQHQSLEAIALLGRIFQEAAAVCDDQQVIQLEHAHQLWQAYFLLEEESPEAVENVPAWFCDYLQDKWTVEKARGKVSSARHQSLSQALQFMGVEHYNEHDEDIDVAIVLKGNAVWTHETEDGEESIDRVSVAVEFDGPNHFTREKEPEGNRKMPQPRALGHTVLKYRLLKKQGWNVVRVPYYEYDKIPFWASMVSGLETGRETFCHFLHAASHFTLMLFQERQRYLQRKLKTHANIKFSETDISEYKTLTPNRKSRFD